MFQESVALPPGVQDGCVRRSLGKPHSRPNVGRSHSSSQPFIHPEKTSQRESNQVSFAQAEKPLGNIGISAVPLEAEIGEKTALEASELAKSWLNKVYEIRNTVGSFYSVVRPCGHYPRKQGQDVAVVKGKSGSVYYTNLQQCKSRWACPVCSTKIAKHRADEVRNMLTHAVEVHSQVGVMITLTLPHYSSDRLKYLSDHVRGAFRDMTADNKYKGKYKRKKGDSELVTHGLKQKYGVKGYVRALEVKKSLKHGWHPHVHVCFMMDAGADIGAFSKKFISLWAKHIFKRTGKKIVQKVQDWREITEINGISDYTSKWDLARELVQSNGKDDGSGLPVFKLVELFQETGNMQYMKDFLTFAHAMKGVTPVSYSKGFKLACLSTPRDWAEKQVAEQDCEEEETEEKTDAEICEEEDIEQLLMSL
ncbi:protein rep, partial [Rufibacter glacialis]